MPLYEYICDDDGTTIELLRPMADADKPVDDPDHKGRTFRRQHSTFATAAPQAGPSAGQPLSACCPCGKLPGSCSA